MIAFSLASSENIADENISNNPENPVSKSPFIISLTQSSKLKALSSFNTEFISLKSYTESGSASSVAKILTGTSIIIKKEIKIIFILQPAYCLKKCDHYRK